jgi:Ca2+-binding RTX toxin-like protein
MTVLTAQQSVDTRDLPELALIKNGSDGRGTFSEDVVPFTFGDIEVILISEVEGSAGDFALGGGLFSFGNVRAFEVKIDGNAGHTLTGFEFVVSDLFADASDNDELDTLIPQIFAGNDELNGSPFGDVLFAFGSDDVLDGNDGNDELDGGANHDELTGGLGADLLRGGADLDTFIFLSIAESTKGKAGRDTILDFNRAEGDTIDLSAIDAKRGDGKVDGTFKFIKKKAFHDKKGELRYKVTKDGDALLQGDTDGNGKADFAIVVTDITKLKHTDFDL